MANITDVALQFVNNNKSMECDKDFYSSPRISSEFPDCALPLTYDGYSYCSFGCLYCFSYNFKTNNPSHAGNLKLKSTNVKHVIDLFEGKSPNNPYYKHFLSKRFVFHIGGMADIYCNFEKKNKKQLPLIQYLADKKYPTKISTKGDIMSFPEHKQIYEKFAHNKNFAFQYSIITSDEEIAKQLEIGVPTVAKRFENLKWLAGLGYYTALRLRPFIIGISDKNLQQTLQAAKDSGIKAVSMEFFAQDMRCNEGMEIRYGEINRLTGFNMTKFLRATSPMERGTYRRSNRDVKEEYVKQVYIFCKKNNILFSCSDPDFKELNGSSCCCGLPDLKDNTYNPELSNFSKNQLTHKLRLMGEVYRKTGEKQQVRFSEMFDDPDFLGFWDDNKLMSDSVLKSQWQAGKVQTHSYKKSYRDLWNNIESPKNPFNYFHGKLFPLKKDENGDIVYEYRPTGYEERWKKEGVFDDKQ